jgi:alpha-tubulin suppressor-like RCC1 family protein
MVSTGDRHSCGITTGSALYCWGNNADGQLGDSTNSNRGVPTMVRGALTWQTVSVGFNHTCGVVTSGAAYCWGRNDFGQFGNGTSRTASPVPVAVGGGLTFTSLSSSLNYTCGVTVTGDAWCWGFTGVGTWGQLGDGGHLGSSSPVKVGGGLAFASVTAGVYLYSDESTNAGTAAHTCGVTTGGVTYCWGDNLIGQLGVGTNAASYIPVKVSGQP